MNNHKADRIGRSIAFFVGLCLCTILVAVIVTTVLGLLNKI